MFPRKHEVLNCCSSKRKTKRHPGLNQEKYSKLRHGTKMIVRFEGEQSEGPVTEVHKEVFALLWMCS